MLIHPCVASGVAVGSTDGSDDDDEEGEESESEDGIGDVDDDDGFIVPTAGPGRSQRQEHHHPRALMDISNRPSPHAAQPKSKQLVRGPAACLQLVLLRWLVGLACSTEANASPPVPLHTCAGLAAAAGKRGR